MRLDGTGSVKELSTAVRSGSNGSDLIDLLPAALGFRRAAADGGDRAACMFPAIYGVRGCVAITSAFRTAWRAWWRAPRSSPPSSIAGRSCGWRRLRLVEDVDVDLVSKKIRCDVQEMRNKEIEQRGGKGGA